MDPYNTLYNEEPITSTELHKVLRIIGAYEGPKLVINKGKTNVKKILAKWNR